MAQYNINPVREQIRTEILAALAAGAPLSASDLYPLCPSASESHDIPRLAHELTRKGLLVHGDKTLHPLGMWVNTYRLASAERPLPKTVSGHKPAPGHPFKAAISPQHPAQRVTRDLPIHLTTPAPQTAAEALDDATMSEDPPRYVHDPNAFSLEPLEPEADAEDIDSELVDALIGLSHLEPKDADAADVLAMAAADVGEITAAMVKKTLEPLLSSPANKGKGCQCLRINTIPPLPKGYVYGGIKVWIESEHDVGRLTIATHDEGCGVFCTLTARGQLSFDPGDLVTMGQVADALIKLHESMGDDHE